MKKWTRDGGICAAGTGVCVLDGTGQRAVCPEDHSNRKQNAVRSGHAGHIRRLITCFDGGYPPGRRQYPARQEGMAVSHIYRVVGQKGYMQLPIDEVYTGKQKTSQRHLDAGLFQS